MKKTILFVLTIALLAGLVCPVTSLAAKVGPGYYGENIEWNGLFRRVGVAHGALFTSRRCFVKAYSFLQ